MVLEPFRETLSQHQRLKGSDEPVRIAHLLTGRVSLGGLGIGACLRLGERDLTFSLECKTFEEWQQGLLRANQEADVVFITNYHTLLPVAAEDADSGEKVRTVPGPDVISWAAERVQLPMFGAWGFLVEWRDDVTLGVAF